MTFRKSLRYRLSDLRLRRAKLVTELEFIRGDMYRKHGAKKTAQLLLWAHFAQSKTVYGRVIGHVVRRRLVPDRRRRKGRRRNTKRTP